MTQLKECSITVIQTIQEGSKMAYGRVEIEDVITVIFDAKIHQSKDFWYDITDVNIFSLEVLGVEIKNIPDSLREKLLVYVNDVEEWIY